MIDIHTIEFNGIYNIIGIFRIILVMWGPTLRKKSTLAIQRLIEEEGKSLYD